MSVNKVYVDTSALAKLLRIEPESGALLTWLNANDALGSMISATLVHTELRRALGRDESEVDDGTVADLAAAVAHIALSVDLLIAAGKLGGPELLRSLDAIHVVAALSIGAACDAFITYDKRQAEAARQVGLNVVSPT
jgi:uncharacterized protein